MTSALEPTDYETTMEICSSWDLVKKKYPIDSWEEEFGDLLFRR